jgi:hypothetical protein
MLRRISLIFSRQRMRRRTEFGRDKRSMG